MMKPERYCWGIGPLRLAGAVLVLCRMTLLCALLLRPLHLSAAAHREWLPLAVVCDGRASPLEQLAAKEIRRYVYVRTGTMSSIVGSMPRGSVGGVVVLGTKDREVVRRVLEGAGTNPGELGAAVAGLEPQQYRLKTIRKEDRQVLLIAGGDPIGTLYGAYRVVEHLGVRFYLDGDVLPDEQVPLALPELDESGKPLFALRGILPFHDFPEGPDLWNLDDYRGVCAQLAKLRMNFIGLHTYTECGWGTEPTVWIGLPKDVAPDGSVRFSPPAHYFSTARSASGHAAKKTSDFGFGASQLFAGDQFGPDVMRGLMPCGKNDEERNELYRRAGELLREAFTYAHTMGIKTCVGTEMPLSILSPKVLRDRLQEQGKDINEAAVLRELYRGTFQRIGKTYPLDYYWLWTNEGWRGAVPDKIVADVERNLLAAVDAASDVKAPFTLATAGWALGPDKDRTLYDRILPKEMPFSCINLELGTVPVDSNFARLKDRPKWAIPWLEDDLSMSTPQMWVGRVRKDASDALKYGCTGLMGIHWRTREVGPELTALAAAGWDQSGWQAVGPAPKATDTTVEVVGGQTVSFGEPVADTDEVPLYQSVRYDVSAYRLKLPNGQYKVRLQFCEPVYTEANKRVFGVTLQGRTVIERLDIFAKVGRNRALDYTFGDVAVADGQLEIGFLKDRSSEFMKGEEVVGPKGLKEFPCIAAFAVEGPDFTRKVNCGGGAYRGYEADPVSDQQQRYLPTGDFYFDWASHQFGLEVAEPIAEILQKIDGHLPAPAPWCPGGISPDGRPWAEVEAAYRFVDALAALESMVVGVGNRERFGFWLNNFRYLKATGRVACRIAEVDRAMARVNAEPDATTKKQLAREVVLPLRLELRNDWGAMVTLLLGTVGNWGEIGTVLTHEMFNMQELKHFDRHDKALEEIFGEPLPTAARPWPDYRGRDRILLPTTRTSLIAGEDLKLRLMLLSNQSPKSVELYWRRMGKGEFTPLPFRHEGRGVYAAVLPAKAIGGVDIEYHARVETGGGRTLCYPATAPTRNHTVVIMP